MKKTVHFFITLGLVFMLMFPAYAGETASTTEIPKEAQELIQRYQENQEDMKTYFSASILILSGAAVLFGVGHFLDRRKKDGKESKKDR